MTSLNTFAYYLLIYPSCSWDCLTKQNHTNLALDMIAGSLTLNYVPSMPQLHNRFYLLHLSEQCWLHIYGPQYMMKKVNQQLINIFSNTFIHIVAAYNKWPAILELNTLGVEGTYCPLDIKNNLKIAFPKLFSALIIIHMDNL